SLLTTIQVSSVAGGASYPRCHGMTPCLQRWPRAHADHVTSSYPSYRETALTEIGRHVITVGWSPGALAVSRIITVQAERFPELERLAHEEGWVAAVDHKRFIRSVRVGSIASDQTRQRLRPMSALSQKRTCAIRSR